MACIVTEGNLELVEQGPNIVIHQPDDILNSMEGWSEDHHLSGLTDQSRNSTTSLEEAEEQMLHFIQQHTPPGCCPLAGNSIHRDKKFLKKYMPNFWGTFTFISWT